MSQELHDRATRGEQLTREQRAQLEDWYVENDRQEAERLSSSVSVESIDALRGQVDQGLAELTATTQRIRDVAATNESIRRENEDLRRQLAARSTSQAT